MLDGVGSHQYGGVIPIRLRGRPAGETGCEWGRRPARMAFAGHALGRCVEKASRLTREPRMEASVASPGQMTKA